MRRDRGPRPERPVRRVTDTIIIAPDERAVRAALKSAVFQSGVDSGRWRLVSFDWPVGVFAVSAAARNNSPAEYGLRIDFTGYPQQAPTAEPWSLERGERLAPYERPKGERAAATFRCDWEQGRALYAPWDRIALTTHPNWGLPVQGLRLAPRTQCCVLLALRPRPLEQ